MSSDLRSFPTQVSGFRSQVSAASPRITLSRRTAVLLLANALALGATLSTWLHLLMMPTP